MRKASSGKKGLTNVDLDHIFALYRSQEIMMMRCTYAAGLSSVGEFYCNRNAHRFESWPAVPGGHSDRISGSIIDHESPMAVLIYSAAILILVITLWLCNSNRLKRE